MKLSVFIDKEREEEVIVYAHETNRLVADIERLVSENGFELIGYNEREAVRLQLDDIYCFITESNKVYAVTEGKRLQIKQRLYVLEEKLSDSFVKINQSCIANIKRIKCFDASISGTLRVIFKNGHTDYVSRRNIKTVKERLGL